MGDAREMGEVSLLETLAVGREGAPFPLSCILFDILLVRTKCWAGVWGPEVELEMSVVELFVGTVMTLEEVLGKGCPSPKLQEFCTGRWVFSSCQDF